MVMVITVLKRISKIITINQKISLKLTMYDMINQEIHFKKQRRLKLHSFQSYLQARTTLQKQSVKNVIIQLNRVMADKQGKRFSTELASVVQERPAAACVEETSFDREFITDMCGHKQRSISHLV